MYFESFARTIIKNTHSNTCVSKSYIKHTIYLLFTLIGWAVVKYRRTIVSPENRKKIEEINKDT